MQLRYVCREAYREKEKLTRELLGEFPEALVIPEGGTNQSAVEGIKFMLNEETKDFDYLCCAVGTGGTIAGLAKFAERKQKVLGFAVVRDKSLEKKVFSFSKRRNFQLIDASDGGYGKITAHNVEFINSFYQRFKIPLDPVYTGKMLSQLDALIESGFFSAKQKILVFHTGGLQGIEGANAKLRQEGKMTIDF